VRHLQRTEVREAEEYFSAGQKGSSAMPHKAIRSRASRFVDWLAWYGPHAQAAFEDIACGERDISQLLGGAR